MGNAEATKQVVQLTDRHSCIGESPAESDARFLALLPYAEDPTTDPELLGRIGKSIPCWLNGVWASPARQQLYDALAGNPNTPPPLLALCAGFSPGSFCRNPIVAMLPVEIPNFAAMIWRSSISRLLREPDIPVSLISNIATTTRNEEGNEGPDPILEASLQVALHGEWAEEEWEEKVRLYWPLYIRAEFMTQEYELLQEWNALGLIRVYWIPCQELLEQLNAACDPETDPEILQDFADVPASWAVRLAAVLNPSTPPAARETARQYIAHFVCVDQGIEAHLEGENPPLTRSAIWDLCVTLARRRYQSYDATSEPLAQFFLMQGLSDNSATSPNKQRGVVTRRQRTAAVSEDWRQRLVAALTLPANRRNTRGRTLLSGLVEDNNRLVRVVARARLANPALSLNLYRGLGGRD